MDGNSDEPLLMTHRRNSSDETTPLVTGTDQIVYDVTEEIEHLHDDDASAKGDSDFKWLLYLLMYVEGVGVLFPWNAFITVTDYFSARFDKSDFQGNFENYFSFCFQFFNIAFLVCDVNYGSRIKTSYRIGIPLAVQFIVFTLMAIFVKIDMKPNVFFGVTMVLVAISGTATAFMQGGLFALGAIMRSRYIQGIMSGQGLGGLIVASINVITLAIGGTASGAAFIFFLVSVGVIVFCAVSFFYLMRSSYVIGREHASNRARRLSMEAVDTNGSKAGLQNWDIVKQAVGQVKFMAVQVLLVFVVTLSIFPGLADRIVSSTVPSGTSVPTKGWGKYFVPVGCFVLFNLGDWIGRTLSIWKQIPSFRHYKRIAYPVLLRFGLIILYLFTNIEFNPGNENITKHVPTVFRNDAYPIVFMLVMAISNGYLANLCMEYGPRLADPHLTGISGSFMALALTVGLLLGTLVNFALKGALCHCNPFVGG